MTPEQYKAMEMERMAKMNAAPLANQVFQPVQVTNVPPPPRPQEPQITPQQRQPGIGQQFGRAMSKKAVAAGVDAVTGLPIMTSLGFSKGDKVPKEIHPFPEYEGMEDTPDDYMHLYDPDYFKAKYGPDPRPMPPIIQDPMGPRRPGPSRPGPTFPPIGPLASADFPVAYKNFDLQALPPRLRTEYLMNLERGMPHMDIINLFHWRALHGNSTDPSGTISRYNEGGNVTYAETGRLAKESKTPSVTTVWDQYNRKGMTPNQFHVPAGNPQVSPSKESYWQKAQRTGLFGVPGTKNVYVDPGKGTVAYQREDVKPFTWMWNKGRDFLGYGAPLAERSE